jgi:ABC-type hemin transport system ATPase subunit
MLFQSSDQAKDSSFSYRQDQVARLGERARPETTEEDRSDSDRTIAAMGLEGFSQETQRRRDLQCHMQLFKIAFAFGSW